MGEADPLLWADEGPISQGKILTAVLQERGGDAQQMLRGWTTADLVTLRQALTMLDVRIGRELAVRRGRN